MYVDNEMKKTIANNNALLFVMGLDSVMTIGPVNRVVKDHH